MGNRKDTAKDWSARFEIMDQRTRGGPTIFAVVLFLVAAFGLVVWLAAAGSGGLLFSGVSSNGLVLYIAVVLVACAGLVCYDWLPSNSNKSR